MANTNEVDRQLDQKYTFIRCFSILGNVQFSYDDAAMVRERYPDVYRDIVASSEDTFFWHLRQITEGDGAGTVLIIIENQEQWT